MKTNGRFNTNPIVHRVFVYHFNLIIKLYSSETMANQQSPITKQTLPTQFETVKDNSEREENNNTVHKIKFKNRIHK